jgi:hypothetical protein
MLKIFADRRVAHDNQLHFRRCVDGARESRIIFCENGPQIG